MKICQSLYRHGETGIEHRSNTFDNGQYWVCYYCKTPLSNNTRFEDEIWAHGGVFCSKHCLILHVLKDEPHK